jgi:hypothetical protein
MRDIHHGNKAAISIISSSGLCLRRPITLLRAFPLREIELYPNAKRNYADSYEQQITSQYQRISET